MPSMDAPRTIRRDVRGIICIGMTHAGTSKVLPNTALTDAITTLARIIIIIIAHTTHMKDAAATICIGMTHAGISRTWPNIVKTDATTILAKTITIITTITTIITATAIAPITPINFAWEITFTGMTHAKTSKTYIITALTMARSASMADALHIFSQSSP